MNKKFIIWLIASIIIVGGIFILTKINGQPGRLDAFALCLKEKNATFYGAFWCTHCQSQKALFGKSQKLLPYVECSTPDGQGQIAACQEKQIEGYPTWEFADGSRETGEVSLQRLSEKTGCQLP